MFHATDLNELYDEHKNNLVSKFLAIQLKGSGWDLELIEKLKIVITKYTVFSSFKNNDGNVNITENDRGGAAEFSIGKFWCDKQGIIVPQNKNDPKCFLYACGIAKFKPKSNPDRITKQLLEQIKTFNIEGVNLPPDKKDIKKFEKQNNLNIHCVCAMTDGKYIEIYKSAHKSDFILILMKNSAGASHWCVVPNEKSLSRLILSNIFKSNRSRHICTNCHQNTFQTKCALEKHEKLCLDHEAQITKLPTKKDIIMFKNEHNKIRPPITIYADFECYQPKQETEKGKSSKILSKHIPSGFGFYVRSKYEGTYPSHYQSYSREEDVAKEFIQELIKVRDEVATIPACDIIMTDKDTREHEEATKCYLCGEGFTEENYKVRDHDHHDGHYRGGLHNNCNLKLPDGKFIPIFFHNLKGYDSHLFIKAFHDLEEKPVRIPQNSEKFILFSLYQEKGIKLRFLDSYAFMADSIENLAKNLEVKPTLREVFGKEKGKDLSQKGVFPYEWFDSVDK